MKLIKVIDSNVDNFVLQIIFEKMDKDKSGEISL
jgi:hypothetical protein